VLEITSPSELQREVFGPVLHVLRYRRDELPQLIEQINASGYGLTLGIHSRIDETINFIAQRAHVGNIYINRTIVGAVVGVQPFGGEGKSGTGPKAGGPLYLKRLQSNVCSDIFPWREQWASDDIPNAALTALLNWADSVGHHHVCALGKKYAHTTLLGRSILLPGPTGERNTLAFHARGVVLCAATSTAGLLHQFAAALATGCLIAIQAENLAMIPAGLPARVQNRMRVLDQSVRLDDTRQPIDIALAERSTAPSLYTALAKRDGALVQVIETDVRTEIPIWRLVAERAISFNTTAAGGNASLMTMAG
jgi:RHH-type proline utilization regulon transcriptional repressor/proline dehydrogenase/delta 1-pyrroline-5-carboxylate dehydrogenase